MQHDNSEDPWGFWNDEPTRPLKRVQAGTRAHGDTRMIPVVRREPTRAVPEPPRPRNPLMTRVCVMLGVGLLLVPVALSLRSDKQEVRAAELKPVNTVVIGRMPPAPTDETLAPDTEAPTTVAVTTTAAPTTSPRIEVAPTTVAPTAPPTTATKVVKKATPKTTTTTPSASPPSTQTAAKAACSQTYTVVAGDAWSTIAARAKVSMTSLLAANGATTQTLLLPGKSICLPQGAVDPGPPTTKPPATTQPSTTQPKATVPATTHPPTTQPPTSVVTTEPATTQPAPPANTYSRAQVAQIIRDVWPDNLEDQAIAIATRESNLIPTAHNSCCYGLFQIYFNANKSWLVGIGITSPAQLYDPQVNASAALTLYNKSGWAPWALGTPATTTTVLV